MDEKFDIKAFLKKYKFLIGIIVLVVVKQLLVSNIPITAYPNQGYDDNMMVEMARNLRAGNWLGEYSSNIMIKGVMFPLILATINYFGFSYINTMNLIYSISCIYFIYVIKDLFKTKKSLFFIFLVLLFNPVSYAWWTLQRVYRNGITLAQALFVIGSVFAMYQRRNERNLKILPFSIIGGLSLSSLWLTREDAIWILPFVFAVIGISIVLIILNFINKSKKEKIDKKFLFKSFIPKIILMILPIIILNACLHLNRAINYFMYGVYEYNELSDGYFGKVIHIIYSVKDDENIRFVSVSRDKMNKLYEVSSSLNSIKPELEKSLDAWSYNDRTPGDGEVEDGWFFWAVKDAADAAGVNTSAKNSNDFYKNVYEEIEKGIEDGKLETRMTMPSNLMSPWRNNYFTELPRAMLGMTWYIVNFDGVQTVNYSGDIPDDSVNIRKFEALTNDLAASRFENDSIDNPSKYTENYVERLNWIGNVYKKLGLIICAVSLISYIIFTIYVIKKSTDSQRLDLWLLLTGIMCTCIVLIGGVSYSEITAFYSKYYMYLSGIYPLVSIFTIGNICFVFENVKKKRR